MGGIGPISEVLPPILYVGPVDPRVAVVNISVATANAYYSAFWVPRPVVVSTATFTIVTQSGNMDLGIFDAAYTKLASSGSVAVPAAGQRTQALSASLLLLPGRIYRSAIVFDTAVAVILGAMGASSGIVQAGLGDYKTSDYPLPAGPITPTGGNARTVMLRWS